MSESEILPCPTCDGQAWDYSKGEPPDETDEACVFVQAILGNPVTFSVECDECCWAWGVSESASREEAIDAWNNRIPRYTKVEMDEALFELGEAREACEAMKAEFERAQTEARGLEAECIRLREKLEAIDARERGA